MSFMNTEKEILLNKDKIKSLEIKIKEKEISIMTEGHHFGRIQYENNLLIEESTNFCEITGADKDAFLKKNIEILTNPKYDDVQTLRKSIVLVKNIYGFDDKEIDSTASNSSNIDKFLSERSKLMKKNKLILRFDTDLFTKDEGYGGSCACSIDIRQILDFAELFDFCEFERKIILNNKKNIIHQTNCLIKGKDTYLAIELDKNFSNFEMSITEKDKEKKKEYLFEYSRGLKKQIDELSKLELAKTKNKDNLKISNTILYIPNETALTTVLEIDPEILQYALEKNIEITFPTTFLAIAYYVSFSHAPKGITAEFERYKKIHELSLENKREEIKLNQTKIDKLLKINFEYLKAPSYQVKVTLNHEENYVLEEIVNTKGSNKSSVLRQILMEYNGIYKERDALKLDVEKLKLQMKFLENKRMHDLEKVAKEKDLIREKHISEYERKLLDSAHHREITAKEDKKEIEVLRNELMRRTEQFQLESSSLKDEILKREDFLNEAIKSIEESFANNKQSFKEDKTKKTVQVINPKDINEFGMIMELINQNILILCDITSIAKNDQQRFLDMVYGGVYGLKGKIKKVSNKTFLYIPQCFELFDDSEKS